LHRAAQRSIPERDAPCMTDFLAGRPVASMDLLERFAMTVRTTLSHDWDCPIVIDGEEGTGKSMLALKVGALVDPRFKIDGRHIVFRYGSLLDSIYGLPPMSCIQHDEFGLTAFNREAMSKANKELVKALMVCRDQRKALTLCVPSIWALDPYVRNHRVKWWLHCYHRPGSTTTPPERGYVEIYRVVPYLWAQQPWYSLRGRYHFLPLPPKVYGACKVLKREAIRKQVLAVNRVCVRKTLGYGKRLACGWIDERLSESDRSLASPRWGRRRNLRLINVERYVHVGEICLS